MNGAVVTLPPTPNGVDKDNFTFILSLAQYPNTECEYQALNWLLWQHKCQQCLTCYITEFN
jgi:hypothetical protein